MIILFVFGTICMFGLLILLMNVYLNLTSGFFWLCIVFTALWVIGNILLMNWFNKKGETNRLFKFLYKLWSGFFFYTALMQGIMFTVFTFWAFAVVFNQVPLPENFQEFVFDFIKGSSALAALILVMGVTPMLFMNEKLKGLKKITAVVYPLAVIAMALVPWIFNDKMVGFSETHPPALLFWGTMGIYTLFSAVGMHFSFGTPGPQKLKKKEGGGPNIDSQKG